MVIPTTLLILLLPLASATLQPHTTPHPHQPRDDSAYRTHCLTHHNIHRLNHSAPALTWSDSLAATAQALASRCKFEHDVEIDGGGYGQNIAAGISAENVSAVISELWYNGEVEEFADLYGRANPGMEKFELWGHFSQVVWKGSGEVGCATVYCPDGVEFAEGTYDFTVCNYGGPGNVEGEYAENVGAPEGYGVVGWSYT